MVRPTLFPEPVTRIEIRVPSRLHAKAGGQNMSKLLATSLEQFLDNQPLSKVVAERDGYQGEMERLAAVVKEAKIRVRALEHARAELTNLKRSISQTLRHSLGTEKVSALRLYRRCVDDLAGHEHDIKVIEAHLNALRPGAGAA